MVAATCFGSDALAQLNGSYSIGGADASYDNIEEAIAALSAGISGPVTFTINSGTYTPPAEGYVLGPVTGATRNRRVTFKPADGAVVTIAADMTTPVFTFNGGDFYVLDGSNDGTENSRAWKIINTGNGPVLRFLGDAVRNTVQNMYLVGASNGAQTGIVHLAANAADEGNSYNVIARNTIGDSTGQTRARIAIYARGHATNRNVANEITGNDIINFGRGNNTSYGILMAANNRQVKIRGNNLRQTELTAATNNIDIINGIYFEYDNNRNDTIAYNRIWSLNPRNRQAEIHGIHVAALGTSPMAIHHNMISIEANEGYLFGMFLSTDENASYYVDHNTVSISGAADLFSASYNIYVPMSGITVRNNILSNTRSASAFASNVLLGRDMFTAPFTSNYNLFYNGDAPSTGVGNYDGAFHETLEEWQEGSGQDMNSIYSRLAFRNAVDGDLHIDPAEIFEGEASGTPLDYTADIDGDPYDPVQPDIGADEGNFNGGRLLVTTPNGGEQFPIPYEIPVQFIARRAMEVSVQLSTDNGDSWTSAGTFTAVEGENTFTLHTPDAATSQALVRVVRVANEMEGDLSDASFQIVRPEFTILSPNGGESVLPGGTLEIGWNSRMLPAGFPVQLEYSTDGGDSWIAVEDDLVSANEPGSNSFSWIVPNTPSDEAMVRVRMTGYDYQDVSDAPFTIEVPPQVALLSPNSGKLYAGTVDTVRWSSVKTQYVRVEYSINGGATWENIVPSGIDLPAFIGKYPWKIPNRPSSNVLVRLLSMERSDLIDTSDATLAIVRPELQVLSPNGGERYEMNQNISVSWNASETGNLRLQFSADNGFSWTTLRQNIDPALGSISLTLPGAPTRLGRIRLSDEVRSITSDVSDAPFEIMPARSVVVYAPGAGERFATGSTTVISWEAPRLDRVMIQYSSNNGASWSTVVPSMLSSQGSYVWTVPNQTTGQGKIRISEVGGTIVGESGVFSVVEPTGPELRVLAPNGGENYTEGDDVRIRWYSTGVPAVTLSYSNNDGASWNVIQANVSAAAGYYDWSAPSAPGTGYLVRVASVTGPQADQSDGPFSVNRQLVPSITIVTPAGAEDMIVGSTRQLEWNTIDVTGTMKVEYSVDGGTAWTEITQTEAEGDDSYTYDWTVPNTPAENALLRVISLTAGDTSASFKISPAPVTPIQVLTPNGGEIWTSGDQRNITWDGPDDVTSVAIGYSIDGGTSWTQIATGVPSGAGAAMSYQWTVPTLQQETTTALVAVLNSSDPTKMDISDAVFTIRNSVAGIAGGSAAENGLRLLGNYPNPFSGVTEIRWEQPRSGAAELRIYRADGATVRTLDLGGHDAGRHTATVPADGLASGSYLYELRIGGAAVRGTMIVTR